MTILVSLINNNIHKINFQELQTYYKLYWAITNFIEQIHLSVSGPETKKPLPLVWICLIWIGVTFARRKKTSKNSVNFLYRKYHIQFFFYFFFLHEKGNSYRFMLVYKNGKSFCCYSKRVYSYSVICCYFHEKTRIECLGKPWYKKVYVYGES